MIFQFQKTKWIWRNIADEFIEIKGYKSKKEAIKEIGQSAFDAEIANYAIENANRVSELLL